MFHIPNTCTKQIPYLGDFLPVSLDIKVCEQDLEDGGHDHDDFHERQTCGAPEYQTLQGREVKVRWGKDMHKYIDKENCNKTNPTHRKKKHNIYM